MPSKNDTIEGLACCSMSHVIDRANALLAVNWRDGKRASCTTTVTEVLPHGVTLARAHMKDGKTWTQYLWVYVP